MGDLQLATLDHSQHLLNGCARLYSARQRALDRVTEAEHTKIDREECMNNFKLFDEGLPREIQTAQLVYEYEAKRYVKALPIIRKEAIQLELARWEDLHARLTQNDAL